MEGLRNLLAEVVVVEEARPVGDFADGQVGRQAERSRPGRGASPRRQYPRQVWK